MDCPYCHEAGPADGSACLRCGMQVSAGNASGAAAREALRTWLRERRPVLLAAAGGFALAVVAGLALIFPQQEEARASGLEPQFAAQVPSSEPAGPIAEFAVERAPTPSALPAEPAAPLTSAPADPVPPAEDTAALPPPPAALSAPPPPPLAAALPDVPPPLPDNFDYDPRWGFAPPPRPLRPVKKRPDPVIEPTPPSHTLAMDPNRPIGGFASQAAGRGAVGAVQEATAPAGQDLPKLRED
jgi:hypothetical protein